MYKTLVSVSQPVFFVDNWFYPNAIYKTISILKLKKFLLARTAALTEISVIQEMSTLTAVPVAYGISEPRKTEAKTKGRCTKEGYIFACNRQTFTGNM